LPHCSQIKGRSPVCERSCSARRHGRVNVAVHGAKEQSYIRGRVSVDERGVLGVLAWVDGGVSGASAADFRRF
jgi:hypothetical protein